jgi:hypothetical protein
MDLHFETELQGGLLLVTASGSLAFEATLRILKQVCDTAAEKQVKNILVNCLALDGELSTLERYRIGVEVAAYLSERQLNPRIAFVGKPPAMDGFGVFISQSRGVTTQVFSHPQEALSWLEKWPS